MVDQDTTKSTSNFTFKNLQIFSHHTFAFSNWMYAAAGDSGDIFPKIHHSKIMKCQNKYKTSHRLEFDQVRRQVRLENWIYIQKITRMSYLTNFTVETGRAILVEIIKTVNQPENSKTISLAKGNFAQKWFTSTGVNCSFACFNLKASAGKEMIAMMQLVFPLVMKIQIDVITNFGFPGNAWDWFIV